MRVPLRLLWVDSGLTSFNWYNGADMFVDGCPADVIPLGDIGHTYVRILQKRPNFPNLLCI